MANAVDINNLSFEYEEGAKTIDHISFSVPKGSYTVVLGHNGSGKSTIAKLIIGLLEPKTGDITVDGIHLDEEHLYDVREKVGIVFQDIKLLPRLTVYENVAFALECIGMKGSEIRPKVLNALERVGLKEKVRSFPGELSGGEQQRVCIARAIVNEPKLLICDEPTGNLDPETSEEIMKVIENINKELGTTIIMATHDKDIVNRMKKRVLVINHGVLVGDYAKGSYKTNEGM